jgi:hypothetical protein
MVLDLDHPGDVRIDGQQGSGSGGKERVDRCAGAG